ncbi:MAG: hypothetical protein F4089_01580 [Gammaproteobacteria bacterium]|nr:hypothetical protein [Gammaproteobacteria bacterium]MYJ73844.1 hypothetical protein [Gammaproteobacteria bacterium]
MTNIQHIDDKDVAIHVSDSAILQLLMAGMESYKVRQWGSFITSAKGPAETTGLLWGYTSCRDGVDHVVVEQVATDKFAKGTYWETEAPNDDVTAAKQAVVADRWPHLSMLGDFHTHPYKSLNEATDAEPTSAGKPGGWHASTGDVEAQECRDPKKWAGRVFLILTIARLARFHPDKHVEPKLEENHIIRWQQLKRYRFWLSAYSLDEYDGRFVVSPKANSDDPARRNVYIDVPTVNGTNAWYAWA